MVHPNSAIKTVILRAPLNNKRVRSARLVTQKELSPIYDRRIIRFVIDEAIDAGVERIIDQVSARQTTEKADASGRRCQLSVP
mgnify:CR=1 FL=1